MLPLQHSIRARSTPLTLLLRKLPRAFACFALLTAAVSTAHAFDTNWKATTSPADWLTTSNWTNGLPNANPTKNGAIQNGQMAAITGGTPSASLLYVDNGGVTQSAGTLKIGETYFLGYDANTSGSYSLSGTGTLNSGSYGVVGHNGTGLFTQTGGSNQVMFLAVGNNTTGTGTYQFNSGSISVSNNLLVGNSGTGTFIQTGGTCTCTGASWIGQYTGGNGTYQLQGGTLNTQMDCYVGYSGTGLFINSGGIHQASSVDLGWVQGGSSTYTLTGSGHLIAGYIQFSQGGGNFIQTGGTCVVNNLLKVSGFRGSIPTYAISAGTLSTPQLSLGQDDSTFHEGGKFSITGGRAIINVGNYTQNPLATLLSMVDSSGLSPIESTGTATLSGIWQVTDLGTPPGRIDVLDAAGGISGTFSQVVLPNANWSWGITGNQLWLVNAPEPAPLVLLGLGGVALLGRRRSR